MFLNYKYRKFKLTSCYVIYDDHDDDEKKTIIDFKHKRPKTTNEI